MKHFTTTKFQVLSFRIPDILQRISQGSLSVPDFQRPFVWTYKHKLELFESIVAGIPIGILTFWRTEQRCQIYQKIGPFKIPVQLQSLSKDYINDYILDGHQRIATLFGVLNSSREQAFSNNYTSHKSVLMSEQKPPQWTIYYDLEHGVFADATKETSNPFYIPLHSLIRTFDFLHEREKIFRAIKGDVSHYIERAEHLAQIFWNYEIPIVYITGSTLEEAIETFSRLNSQGHNLTSEQKFNISTYRTTISSRIDTILERLSNDKFKFSTIDKTFILKVIFAALEKDIYKTNINDSINHNILYIDDVIDACKSSLLKVGQFFYEEIKVPNDIRYELLIESVNNIQNTDLELVMEGLDLNKYQFATKKLMAELKLNLYNVGTFGVSITALYPVVANLMATGKFSIEPSIQNVVLLTICALTVLLKENKEKAIKLINFAFEKGVTQQDLDKVVNQLTTTKGLFSEVAKNFGKVISTFSEMLAYTSLLVPFSMILNSLITQGTVTSELLSQSLPAITVSLGATGFKLLISRIMHKLEILIKGTDRFKNAENIKPLLVNDEFKSPELKLNRVQNNI